MFKKKSCPRCQKKVNSSYDFCPNCGNQMKAAKQQDWGLLGKNDMPNLDNVKLPMGLNTIFNALVKNLDKQLQNLDTDFAGEFGEDKPKIRKHGISINISQSGKNPPKIIVNGMNQPQKKQQPKTTKLAKLFSSEKTKEFQKLEKAEPTTNMRRLSDRIIYEIDLPGVKSLIDISINQLENSIEIKAIAKDKAYNKIIPISLPIAGYYLEKGKLVLELDARN